MMNRLSLTLILSLFVVQYSTAQSFLSARRERTLMLTGGMGLSTYFGELKISTFSIDPKPTLNVGLQYMLSQHLSARVEATWFQLGGSDALSGNAGRTLRNLSFFSNNVELNGTIAFSLFSVGQRYYRRPSTNFYFFTGIGLTYFSPTTEYKGETYKLSTYNTEGVNYQLFTPVIPIGIGLRIKATRDINIVIEEGFRMTFTDYLDDVSDRYPLTYTSELQKALSFRGSEIDPTRTAESKAGQVRGNPKSNDAYFLISVKLEYYLPTDFLFGKNQGHRKAVNYKKRKYNYRKPKYR